MKNALNIWYEYEVVRLFLIMRNTFIALEYYRHHLYGLLIMTCAFWFRARLKWHDCRFISQMYHAFRHFETRIYIVTIAWNRHTGQLFGDDYHGQSKWPSWRSFYHRYHSIWLIFGRRQIMARGTFYFFIHHYFAWPSLMLLSKLIYYFHAHIVHSSSSSWHKHYRTFIIAWRNSAFHEHYSFL